MPKQRQECESWAQGADGDARYSNHFQIGHNEYEFVLDFGQLFSDGRTERMHTRIVTTPWQARELLVVLSRSVAQYEESFGSIVRDSTSDEETHDNLEAGEPSGGSGEIGSAVCADRTEHEMKDFCCMPCILDRGHCASAPHSCKLGHSWPCDGGRLT